MEFEWDEEKNQINISKHSFNFKDAWEIFESDVLTVLDDREDYGEDRWIGIGVFRGRRILAVVFTERGDDLVHIISVRKATKEEREYYEKEIFGN